MTDHWLQSALKNDVQVVELLLQVKHSSNSNSLSSRRHPPPATTTSTEITTILPPRWGHRKNRHQKNRSKSTAPTTTAANGGKEHRGSPTTHLSWSGGGGSTSDGCDESSRPSDLSSGFRSIKVNEGASTSGYNKSEKRKVFPNEQEMTSMRVPMSQQMPAFDESLKRNKIDLDRNRRTKLTMIGEQQQRIKLPSLCRVEAETVAPQKGFVLPDLNMMPDEEDLAMSMS